MTFTFDVLPIHPQPQPLETLTSYLTRLAEANGLPTIFSVAQVCFPSFNTKIVRSFNDYPPLSLDTLSIVANCPRQVLYAMTFAPISNLFGRSIHPQAVSRFLGGTIAKHLRYCPDCLKERPWYILPWRFLLVETCPIHQSYLLDTCFECGNKINILSHLKIGICPTCQGELSQAIAIPVEVTKEKTSHEHWNDINYLYNTGLKLPERIARSTAIGATLKRLRISRNLTARDVATIFQMSTDKIYAVEQGLQKDGFHFRDYVSYASILDLSLREIILFALSSNEDLDVYTKDTTEIVQRMSTENTLALLECDIHLDKEQQLLDKVRNTISEMQVSGQAVTRWAVAAVAGMKRGDLNKYPRIRAEIEQAAEKRTLWLRKQFKDRSQYVSHLIYRVQNAISYLRTTDMPLTKYIVYAHSGVIPKTGYNYPEIDEIVSRAVAEDQAVRTRKYIEEAQSEFCPTHIENEQQCSTLEFHLTPDEILERWRKCQSLKEARYWHVIWLLSMGIGISKVSLIVRIKTGDVRAIRARYNEEGSDKVLIQTRSASR